MAVFWKQWKKVRTRFSNFKRLGITEQKAWELADTRKSYWRVSGREILKYSITNRRLISVGYIMLTDITWLYKKHPKGTAVFERYGDVRG